MPSSRRKAPSALKMRNGLCDPMRTAPRQAVGKQRTTERRPKTAPPTAALVIGLGIIINSYWVSSLIVGVIILAVAGFLVKGAISGFKKGMAPRQTVQSVREDVDWAKRESQRVKQELSA